MLTTARALGYVSDLLYRLDADGKPTSQIVTISGAYDPDPNSPNHAFWTATPQLKVEMTITNDATFAMFASGQKVWIDFTPILPTT